MTSSAKASGPASGPQTSSNRGFLLIVVGIVAVGLLGIAVLATNRNSDDSTTVDQTAAVEISGDALIPLPEGVSVGTADTDPAFGTTAPTLTATDFSGNDVTIGPDGRPKAIYFLAHWCPHCQTEVPVVQDLIDEGSLPDGMDVYAVSTAVDRGRGNYPPQTWLEDEGFEPVTVRDDDASSALVAFGGSSFPYVVYLDGDNQVFARSAGSLAPEAIASLWSGLAAG